jgi:ribonuclease Z
VRFEVTILGSSSATPVFNRNPSAQLLNVNDKYYLIDCGEGTQLQLLRYGLKAQRIDHILISHLHGDHYLGLVGLLSSLHLNGRTRPMYLYGPKELKEIIEVQFLYSQTDLRFPLVFVETDSERPGVIFSNEDLVAETFPLEHRIPCTGFRFTQQPRLRRILKAEAEAAGIPAEVFPVLKRGLDFTTATGRIYRSADFTVDPERPRSYAYCSDTLDTRSYMAWIRGADTLYHEATFLHDMLPRALETFHTTARQAGEIAQEAGAGHLLIGHFSARYRELKPLLDECKSVFEKTQLAVEGTTFTL